MTVKTVYLGSLRTEATHIQSGSNLLTDAPTDNKGKGEAFSPTDLVAAAYSSCMMTIMGIVAERESIDLSGSTIETTKIMTTQLPRGIARLEVVMNICSAIPLSENQRDKLEKAARTCPVEMSLHPDIEREVLFTWTTVVAV